MILDLIYNSLSNVHRIEKRLAAFESAFNCMYDCPVNGFVAYLVLLALFTYINTVSSSRGTQMVGSSLKHLWTRLRILNDAEVVLSTAASLSKLTRFIIIYCCTAYQRQGINLIFFLVRWKITSLRRKTHTTG